MTRGCGCGVHVLRCIANLVHVGPPFVVVVVVVVVVNVVTTHRPLCEALYALTLAYTLTEDRKWLDWLERVHKYTIEHMSDFADLRSGNENGNGNGNAPRKTGQPAGEWFGYLNPDGSVFNKCKGGNYKGFFHVPRALLFSSEYVLDCFTQALFCSAFGFLVARFRFRFRFCWCRMDAPPAGCVDTDFCCCWTELEPHSSNPAAFGSACIAALRTSTCRPPSQSRRQRKERNTSMVKAKSVMSWMFV